MPAKVLSTWKSNQGERLCSSVGRKDQGAVIILEKFLVKFSDRKKMEGGGYGGNLENDDEETAVYYRSQFHTTKLILEICVVTLMVENYRNYDPAYAKI